MDAEDDEDSGDGGGWITTFADLMALLMCFFVLLLSFSEMDAEKYRQLAGSMKNAFGVQRALRIDTMPKASSLLKTQQQLGNPDNRQLRLTPQQPTPNQGADQLTAEQLATLENQVIAEANAIKQSLKKEIQVGQVEVVTDGMWILIRVTEKGSFPSGLADLDPKFLHVLARLRKSLHDIKGQVSVEGHTDDVPIKTERYRSNWELSASRAVSVAHELLKDSSVDPNKVSVTGLGSTKPLVKGVSAKARARNRRVEVVIRRMDELVRQQAKETKGPRLKPSLGMSQESGRLAESKLIERVGTGNREKGAFNRPKIDLDVLEIRAD